MNNEEIRQLADKLIDQKAARNELYDKCWLAKICPECGERIVWHSGFMGFVVEWRCINKHIFKR